MRSEISVNVPSASTPLTPADPTTINTHSPPPQPLMSFSGWFKYTCEHYSFSRLPIHRVINVIFRFCGGWVEFLLFSSC